MEECARCPAQPPCQSAQHRDPPFKSRPAAQVTPLFTGYSALNPNIPTPVSVRCGEGPQPVNFSASASPSAQQYLYDLKRIVGDSYQTINGTQPKGTYNQSFGPGMYWTGKCVRSPILRCAKKIRPCQTLREVPEGGRAWGTLRLHLGGAVHLRTCCNGGPACARQCDATLIAQGQQLSN